MTPASSRARSRAASRSRVAPVLRAMASKVWLPNEISRTANNAHFSPTTCSAAAIEQGRPLCLASCGAGLGVCMRLGCHIKRTTAIALRQLETWTYSGVSMLSASALTAPRFRPVLVSHCGDAVAMANLDLFIVNVALPSIGRVLPGTGQCGDVRVRRAAGGCGDL